jgi:3-hydroxybutyrate dehydrogenase
MIGFAKTIALETADTDITINTVCPSYVRATSPDSGSRWDGGWTAQ